MPYDYLDRNADAVRKSIRDACTAVGRDPDRVLLTAAIKSAEVDEILYLHEKHGISVVGENRVQQLLERYEPLHNAGLTFHFIGTLQTNKVKYIIDKVDMIQSLDSEKLAREIEKQAAKIDRTVDVLIEINSGHEESKSGIAPEAAADFARRVTSGEFPHLRLRGFMTMAPRSTDEEYHSYFGDTRTLCEDIWRTLPTGDDDMVLSMGMSESYAVAAAEGATLVRVGRTLFAKVLP